MPVADLGDVQLYYEWAGAEDAPVLVLSNSLGSDLRLWEPQISALGGNFRLLRYDTRGHGRSSTPDGEYTLEDLGMDVLCLLDYLDVEEAGICGISLGGITALWLALHASSRIEAVVAANTAARIGTVEGWTERIRLVREGGLAPLAEGTMDRWLTAAFRKAHPEMVATLKDAFVKTSVDGYVGCCAALREADLTEKVASIRVPVLSVAGRFDPVTPPTDARFLEEKIAGCRYVELDAAHLSNMGDTDGFNAAVLSFF